VSCSREREIGEAVLYKRQLEAEVDQVKDQLVQVQQQLKSVFGELEEAKRINHTLHKGGLPPPSGGVHSVKGQNKYNLSSSKGGKNKSVKNKDRPTKTSSNGEYTNAGVDRRCTVSSCSCCA
jgi:hypothetical protein